MTSETTPQDSSPQALQRRYRWQCRRGSSEVEVILNAYLESGFPGDSPDLQAEFGRLLECDDVDLLDWFTRHSQPQDSGLSHLVARILDHVAAHD